MSRPGEMAARVRNGSAHTAELSGVLGALNFIPCY